MIPPRPYGFTEPKASARMEAPRLDYLPPRPRRYRPKIALIGCGGVSIFHLRAYQAMGLEVAMLCSRTRAKAEARAREFYPEAKVVTDIREVLRSDEIEVVDITTHPADRVPLMRAALEAGKHVLSQKPFVLDLEVGARLADLAEARGVCLAVNQNGRWAPHWSYLTQLVRKGKLGELATVDFTVAWDHSWVRGTAFDSLHYLVLYDFAVHWFDIATVFLGGRRAKSVYAITGPAPGQAIAPPALASIVADYGDAQVRWSFHAANRFAPCERTLLCGTRGTAESTGPSLLEQRVTVTTSRGTASPELQGNRFENGFQGAMGELLRAIEERREPRHSARGNLATLELAFAALASAESGQPVTPGRVQRLSPALRRKCQPVDAKGI